MIGQIKINAKKLAEEIGQDISSIAVDLKPILRIVSFDLLALMVERIHEKGQDSTGAAIGTYGNAYLKLRQKKYKRSADSKVIISLTRQLENDWAVGETELGWGVGFNNPYNISKAGWVEEHFGKKIFYPTDAEVEYVQNRINELMLEKVK